jgi:hypothetical protein
MFDMPKNSLKGKELIAATLRSNMGVIPHVCQEEIAERRGKVGYTI